MRWDWTDLWSNIDFIKCVDHSFCSRKSRYNSSSLWLILYSPTFLTLLKLTVRILNCLSECESLCDLSYHIFIELIFGKYFFQALSCFDCLITRMRKCVWPCADILDSWPRLAVHRTISAHCFRRLSVQVLDCPAKFVVRLLAVGDGMRSARDCRWHIGWLETFRVRQPPLSVLTLITWLQAIQVTAINTSVDDGLRGLYYLLTISEVPGQESSSCRSSRGSLWPFHALWLFSAASTCAALEMSVALMSFYRLQLKLRNIIESFVDLL